MRTEIFVVLLVIVVAAIVIASALGLKNKDPATDSCFTRVINLFNSNRRCPLLPIR